LRAHPLIGQAVAIGDRCPYVTALIVLDEEMAPVWAGRHGPTADLAGLSAEPVLLAEIRQGNARSPPRSKTSAGARPAPARRPTGGRFNRTAGTAGPYGPPRSSTPYELPCVQ